MAWILNGMPVLWYLLPRLMVWTWMQEVNHTQVGREECTLRSAALGTMTPPVQSILLRNTGPGPMAFKLVQEALTALTEANHGFPVSILSNNCSHLLHF